MPITYKNLYPEICSFPRLRRSFYKAAHSKYNRYAVANFSHRLEENLRLLSLELKNHSYVFGPYRAFYIIEPKRRLIESARFRDRVVHHSIFQSLEPIFEAQFYEHSYACRSDRGHHKAMLILHKWMKEGAFPYFLKCDVKKFFPSINRKILLKILSRTIKDHDLLLCLEKLINTAPKEEGIPIGNLTSQLFANIYLNDLDQYIKRKLRVKKYVRYMDDFVLLTKSFEEASSLRKEVENFLDQQLNLHLSPQKVTLGACKEGISFLGFHVKKNEIRLRSRFLRQMRKKMARAIKEELIQSEDEKKKKRFCPSPFLATLNSYLGHIKYCTNNKNLIKELTKVDMR